MANQDEAERARQALIEKRAYEIYESRGGHHGFDIEDWDEAARQVDGIANTSDVLLVPDEEEVTEERSI